MSAPPYMALYPRDYIADTTHLTRDEDGGYFLLLMAMWLRGGALPDDDRQLAHITKCSTKSEWKKLRAGLENFFEISGGFWRQKRLAIEYERAEKQHVAKSEAARSTNEKRWGKRPDSGSLSDIRAEGSLPEPEPSLFENQEVFSPRARPRAKKPGILETQMEGFARAAGLSPRGNGRAHREVVGALLDRGGTRRGENGDC